MPLKQAITLLQEFEEFAQKSGTEDISRFALWLHRKYNAPLLSEERPAKGMEMEEEESLNREIGYLLGRINRYSRHYAKIAFDGLPITTIEEFWFLNVIFHTKNPSKTEIYDATITELATGTQMLRRLIDLGLLKEEIDKEDKRVRRVRLTKEGRRVRTEALERLGVEVRLKVGNLEKQDKYRFVSTLRYLDHFHKNIYQYAEKQSLAGLVEEHCA